jgi:hypothetical protein
LNVSGYFNDGKRDISSLYSPFKIDEQELENDDSTLNDLLSPL